MNLNQVLEFIKSKPHTVISTCDKDNQPEAAVIGFGETDDLELVFGTYKTSRKYKNILKNNKVAFVIGWDSDYITVQYEGIAIEIFGEEREKYLSLFHSKLPSAAHYKNHPEQTYFKVKPTWIRYSDLSGDEEKIFEFKF